MPVQPQRCPVEAEYPHKGAHTAVPSGAPAWITPELVAQTLKVWQPRYKDQLSAEDAVTILLSASRLFDVLARPPVLPCRR